MSIRYLTTFLGSRFLGYLLFAAVAWEIGALIALPPAPRLLIVGIIHVLLAGVLVWYAYAMGRACAAPCPSRDLVTLEAAGKPGSAAPAALGFLTGLSLCPPFVVAGVRAAQLHSVFAALLFFAVFFVGTSVWFVPLASLGCVRRTQAVTTVARMAMVLIAFVYLCLGFTMLMGGKVHGY